MERPNWKTIAAALAALALALAPRGLPAQDVGIPLGSVPEAVQIEDLDGQPVDLGQYIGKTPVFIEFWAAWCEVCQALQPRVEAAYQRFGQQAKFLTIAVAVNQTPRSVQRHLTRHPIPGRVLWDTNGRAVRAFQAPATSYVVVLDRHGRVAYTGIGEDQDLIAAIAKALDSQDGPRPPSAAGRR